MESKCPFQQVCGAAIVRGHLAKRDFPENDPRRNWAQTICGEDGAFEGCCHYEIRIKLGGILKRGEKL